MKPRLQMKEFIHISRDVIAWSLIVLSWLLLVISLTGPAYYAKPQGGDWTLAGPDLSILLILILLLISAFVQPLPGILLVTPLFCFAMTPILMLKRRSLFWTAITHVCSVLLLAPWLLLSLNDDMEFRLLWGGQAVVSAFTMSFLAIWMQPAPRRSASRESASLPPRDVEYERALNLRLPRSSYKDP